jgi:two-component system cell cycle response regulator DivK
MPDRQSALRKILIAEDTSDIRALIAFQLRMLGYSVSEAVHGEDAVTIARQTQPDLILMDLNMPIMSGFEATRLIRGDANLRFTKIVGFSALPTTEVREAALAAGCDDFVEKNLELGVLKRLVERFL